MTGVCCFGVWRFAAFWQDGATQAREGVYKGFERKLVGHNLHLIEWSDDGQVEGVKLANRGKTLKRALRVLASEGALAAVAD